MFYSVFCGTRHRLVYENIDDSRLRRRGYVLDSLPVQRSRARNV